MWNSHNLIRFCRDHLLLPFECESLLQRQGWLSVCQWLSARWERFFFSRAHHQLAILLHGFLPSPHAVFVSLLIVTAVDDICHNFCSEFLGFTLLQSDSWFDGSFSDALGPWSLGLLLSSSALRVALSEGWAFEWLVCRQVRPWECL